MDAEAVLPALPMELQARRAPRRRLRLGRALLIGSAVLLLCGLILLPLLAVFAEALRHGAQGFARAFEDPDAWHALLLSLKVAAIVVPLNTVFGVALAWLIARHRFPGRSLLQGLIDLPFSVSPVVAGLLFVLVFGRQGWGLGPWLADFGVQVLFSLPGLVLATLFVSFPFVARELIPLLQEQGSEAEQAALSLGASGWQMFWQVTLPNMRWALLYGVLLCNARALGEFGAVSVVSGHIRGQTNTLPLQVEILHNEFAFSAAFALASVLALLALLSLIAKALLEWKHGDELAAHRRR
jgi:sulfate/thiosulfate transport system permease protein